MNGATAQNETKLSFRHRLGFGVGDAGFNLFFTTASLYLLYFYTDVMGLSPSTAGWVFGIPLIWDAFFDPFMGYISSKTKSRWGRYRPYLLFGSIPMAAAWVLMFVPTGFTGTTLVIFAIATHILFRTLYAVVSMPYLALSAAMTSNSDERGVLAGFRMVSATVCGLLVAFFTLQLVEAFGGGETGFLWTAILFGILAVLIFFFTFANTLEQADVTKDEPDLTIKDMIRMLISNRAFWLVAAAMMAGSIGGTMFNKSLPYYFKYALGREDLIGPALAIVIGTISLSIPVWTYIMKRTSKRQIYIWGTVIATIGYISVYFAPAEPAIIMVSLAIVGAGSGAGHLSFWAMMPDTVEYGEWRTGIRAEGAIFGVVSLIQKAALGFAAVILGQLLSFVGYQANEVQTSETLADIKIIMTVLPVCFSIIVIVAINFYPIDGRRHGKLVRVVARIREKRATTE